MNEAGLPASARDQLHSKSESPSRQGGFWVSQKRGWARFRAELRRTGRIAAFAYF